MSSSPRRGRPIVFCVVWSLLLHSLSCTTNDQAAATRSPQDAPVTIALNWFPDAQHGGFYGADVFGHFREHQLQATITPGGPAAPVVQNVTLRRVDFAVGNADQIMMARAQGAPIVAIFAAMQHSPRCIMVRPETGIDSFSELQNVTLALGAGKAFAEFLKQQVELKNVQVVPYTGSIAPFLNDERFAQQAYIFSEPLMAQRQGITPITLMVSELGFDPYTSCLFTHEKLIEEDPERVAAVVRAVHMGWRDYLKNPTAVHSRILAANPQIDAESLEYGVDSLRPLVLPETMNAEHLGAMEPERWLRLAEQLMALDLLPADFDASQAFTAEFLTSDSLATPTIP